LGPSWHPGILMNFSSSSSSRSSNTTGLAAMARTPAPHPRLDGDTKVDH
jgi:hypothetical protein